MKLTILAQSVPSFHNVLRYSQVVFVSLIEILWQIIFYAMHLFPIIGISCWHLQLGHKAVVDTTEFIIALYEF